MGPPPIWRRRRVPMARNWRLPSGLRSLPASSSLSGSRELEQWREGWRGWGRGAAWEASVGKLGVPQSSVSLRPRQAQGRRRAGGGTRPPRPPHRESFRRSLGPVRMSAGLWFPGLIWLIALAQEEQITCGALRGALNPGGVTRQSVSLVRIKLIMP